MNTLARLKRLFTRRPIVVSTYSVKKTNADKEFQKTTALLAKELGRPNPLARQ